MDDREQAAKTFRQTLTKMKQFLAQESPPRLSEADTKAEFIERYIQVLGYEGLADIVREYYVKNSQEFIDYVLRVRSQPVLAIEAKPLQTELTDKHAAQLVQYCAVEGIEWCVLTNARSMWLFNTFLRGDQSQKLVAKLDLLGFNTDDEFDAIFEHFWLLSKASFASPTAITSWMEQRRLDQGLRTILLNPHSDSVRALAAELARAAGVTATPEAVVHWVRTHLSPNVTVIPVTPRTLPRPQSVSDTPMENGSYGTGEPRYWIVPCGRAADGAEPIEQLRRWLDRGYWGVYKSTPHRRHLRAGDYICFYANRTGVAATARIAGPADTLVSPVEWPEPYSPSTDVYKLPLTDIRWLSKPKPITKEVRSQLDAFRGRSIDANPGWLVQTTNALTAHDFGILTTDDVA